MFELRQQVAGAAKSAESKASTQPSSEGTNQISMEDIVNKCVAQDPNRGELWCAITKTTALRRADIPTKLKKVAEQLLASK